MSNSNIESKTFLVSEDTTSFGILPAGELMAFDIFPNPATDYVTLSMHNLVPNESINISLISLTGKEMFKENIRIKESDHDMRINVQNISTGIYFISITYKKSTLTKKIIIR